MRLGSKVRRGVRRCLLLYRKATTAELLTCCYRRPGRDRHERPCPSADSLRGLANRCAAPVECDMGRCLADQRARQTKQRNQWHLAEREGFEPPIRLPVCRISSAVLSTTQPPLRGRKAQTSCRSRAMYPT